MKKCIVYFSSFIFISGGVYATPINVDVYGVSSDIQEKIFTSCKKEIEEFDSLSQKITLPSKSEELINKRHKVEQLILNKITRYGNFAMAKIGSVNYGADQGIYTTIDLVRKEDVYRIPKPSKRTIKNIKKPNELTQVLQSWNNYLDKSTELFLQGKLTGVNQACPVAHCLFGFTEKEKSELLPIFKNAAVKYKKQLIDIIKYSKDESERGDAIFLIANNTNYHELVTLLVQYISDSSEIVRNNTMRVLASILIKHDIKEFDLQPVLLALNYPCVTDRNKAAAVLYGVVRNNKSSHAVVIKQAGDTLVNLLKLKQPNNHDIAYEILKELSNKKYSDIDYQSWQKWIDQQNKPNKKV